MIERRKMGEKEAPGNPRRREAVLDAALLTFARYGYRKTSMEDVAQAASISRPGLYIHFSNKEDLYHATIEKALQDAIVDVSVVLNDSSIPLENRLVTALDEWLGRYVGTAIKWSIGDLLENNAEQQLETLFIHYRATFVRMLAEAIEKEVDRSSLKAGIDTLRIAEALHAVAIGWRQQVNTRAEFVTNVRTAVRLILP